MSGERMLSTKAAADKLGKRPGTLENWRYHGKGPRFKTDPISGRFVGYPESEIDAYIGADLVSSNAEGQARRKDPSSPAQRRAALDLGRL